jgi:hypothetical protein
LSQEVRLLGDRGDRPDDLPDLLGLRRQLIHRRDRLVGGITHSLHRRARPYRRLVAAPGELAGGARCLGGQRHILGRLRHRARHPPRRVPDTGDHLHLTLGALCDIADGVGNLAGGTAGLLRTCRDLV